MPRWYALSVKPQHEKAVAKHTEMLGYESFLPLYKSRRTWSDRTKELDLPLFRGYVFSRFLYRDRVRVLNLPGVRRIVGFGDKPAQIPDSQINDLKRIVASGLPSQPWPFLKVGDRVRIEHGALRDMEGILVQAHKSWYIGVSVELLQRSVIVQIERDSVRPVKSK